MSETLSQDPESLGAGAYGLAPNYPPTPATPSSTVQDPPGSNLPPFSTFSADMDTAAGFSTDRFLSDTRLLDISNWDYYPETRILDRTENGLSIITSQPQYRPWESKPVDSTSQQGFAPTTPVTTFADAFTQNGVSKLPSFQSQFQTYNEAATTTEPTLTTLTNLTPVSPNSSSPSLTTLNTNFHTLSAVNPRNYPLVPAPIQAREIPSIQQQFLDERHIQLYTHPTANIASLNPPPGSIFQSQNGAILQNSQLIGSPTVVTVIKSEPDLKLTTLSPQDMKIQNLHPTQFQNPMTTILDNNGLYNGLDKKLNGINATASSPTRNDFRKKERRKIRASSLESSAESDGASSNMDLGAESSGQVAAVSSTASFKTHHAMTANSSLDMDDISGGGVDKQVKKKRKRCGECIGCQRKDNCGDCAPCRNDKSHQICKQRRCEKLTEKKNLYGDQTFMRGESRRGRGKGRGAGSYRGRKPSGSVSLSNSSVPENSVPSSRPSPQPVHMLKPEQPVQQQPMAPMPFYADPTRFTAPVWQAEPAQTWPQGQFIQQIPTAAQPGLEAYPTQQYPNGIYQTTYQQPGFETNTFYTGAVQVLTNTRPPSAPDHSQLTPRTNGSYSHTPSPVPSQAPQQQGTPRSNISGQYHQEYNQGYVAPSTPTGNVDNSSRPSSVNSGVNVPVNNQSFQQQSQQQQQATGGFTSVSASNFSPGSNANPNYVNASSGNEKPGYPQVNSNPQLVSHSSSGYPGNQYGGVSIQQQVQAQHAEQQTQQWPLNSENMMWEPNISGTGGKPISMERHDVAHQQYNQSDQANDPGDQYAQSNRVELNSRIKTMILNKHQHVGDRKHDDEQQSQHDGENKTGHFLWYSHHHRPPDLLGDGGGVPFLPPTRVTPPANCITDKPRQESYRTANTKVLPQKNYDTAEHSRRGNTEFLHCTREIAKKDGDILSNEREILNGTILKGNLDKRNRVVSNGMIINQPHPIRIGVEKQTAPDLISNLRENPNGTYFNEPIATDLRSLHHVVTKNQPEKVGSNTYNQKRECSPSESSNINLFNGSLIKQDKIQNEGIIGLAKIEQKSSMSTVDDQKPSLLVNGAERLDATRFNGNLTNPAKLSSDVLGNKTEKIGSTTQNHKSNEELKPKVTGTEIPCCSCFPPDRFPPEPGSYYTHLGCSSSLVNLRKDLESRTGVNGKAIRIEKVRYAGKEGKTPQGCPLAKWIIRRSNYDEKYLVVVKHRQGHSCISAYIVVCIVAWEGVGQTEADIMYSTLTDKLNKYGLPTNRRCATNEQRTCACQGLDPKTCGASFSFGCSWSMYYNGCKFARSKIVRKFRLTEKSEEQAMENRLQNLVTFLTPLYKTLAPDSFKNQCIYESDASECRLGLGAGKPFSGVTACMDFCAHTHKDSHNMNNGCTMVVTLTREKTLAKAEDEQLHVLPLYTIDSTDEYGSKECQDAKMKMGSIEVLNRYECEVRIRTVPLQPCRRRKKKDDDNHTPPKKENVSSHSSLSSSGYESSRSQTPQTPIKSIDSSLLQSNHVSSTVMDSPITPKSWSSEGYFDYPSEYDANNWYPSHLLNGSNPEIIHHNVSENNSLTSAKHSVLLKQKYMTDNTAFGLTYPTHHRNSTNANDTNTKEKGRSQPAQINLTQNKVQDSHSGIIRNSNHTVNTNANNHITSNFGISNVYTSKSGESYKFHYPSYSGSPSLQPINSSPITPFKVPFTPESPIRPAVSSNFMHHANFYKPVSMMNQFGRVDNVGYENIFRGGTMTPYGIGSYANHFHTNYQYNAFNPTYSLAHQLFQPNLSFEARIPRPNPISEAAFYQHHYNKTYTQQADIKPSLPPFHFFNNSQNINPNTYHLCNPFDDVGDYGLKRADSAVQALDFTDPYYHLPHWQYPRPWEFTPTALAEKNDSLGKVIDMIDNSEAFMDSQIGGVAIALTHGSVLFECAKHELHATTALKKPNRLAPTRISLVFYQHRNLNASKHGWDQWEEKTRLKKLNSSNNESHEEKFNFDLLDDKANLKMLLENNNEILLRAPTLTTMSVTTLFPMYPCVVTGPYQKHNHSD